MSQLAIDGPVAIVGSGIGGLTLALALKQRGIECQVFERAPQLSEVGAGITLWHNAWRVLQELGAVEAVARITRTNTGGVIALADGRCLVDGTPTRQDKNSVRSLATELRAAHRAELQTALYELLPKGTVHFAAPFSHYEPSPRGVRVSFGAQPPFEAVLLVGADGIHSRVREASLGVEPLRYAGYTCWRGVCPVPNGWKGVEGEFWGRGDRFGVVRLPRDRLYWFAVANAPSGGSDDSADDCKAKLLQRFAAYAFDVPGILQATDASQIIHHDIFDRPARRGWSRGAVTLLGDSIHPTTPNLGQGAAMAMESALVLARVLSEKPSLPEALRCYEAARAQRTARITATSWRLGKLAHLVNPLARTLRNGLLAKLPRSVSERQLNALVQYDAARVSL